VDLREAYDSLTVGHAAFARFYGPAADLALGVGLFLNNVAYPAYDDDAGDFVVAEGLCYVVSHECDISLENDRPLNNAALLCPVIPLQSLLQHLEEIRTEDQVRGFIASLAKSEVDRAAYIPTIAEVLPDGGVLYFGTICSTDVRELARDSVQTVCAASYFGLEYIDQRLHQAILKRPKDQRLPLTPEIVA